VLGAPCVCGGGGLLCGGGGGHEGVLDWLAVEEARDGDLNVPLAAVQERDGFFQVLGGDGGELLERELLVGAERGEVDC
jgi:hypothetical protein